MLNVGGTDPRCEDCPPETCERCGDEIEQPADAEPWEWHQHCEDCRELLEKDAWCENCDSHIYIEGVGYDGVKIACDCSSCHIPIDSLSLRAPASWTYDGPRGERRFSE